jgi:capsular polysaccharide biosynthesis protein
MSKRSHKSGQGKPYNTSALGRTEQAYDDDRPFAEIRKTLHDALRLLTLHRWMFFVPFCLVTCAAFIASLYFPRTYSATTSFEVRNDPVMINLPMSAGAASFKYFRNTMVRDLTSVECMAEAVEKLDLIKGAELNPDGTMTAEPARRRDSLARSLGGNVSVTVNSPSELIDIVKITYTGPDSAIGRSLVDQLKKTYIRRTTAWIREYLVAQRDYFLREAAEAREQLLRAERVETQLRLENPHVNPTDPGAISTRLAQLESERRELLLRKREYETELDGLRQLLAAAAPQGVASNAGGQAGFHSPEALKLATQMEEIDKNVLKLRETRGMTDEHPEIRETLATRERLQEKLAQQQERDRTTGAVQGPVTTDLDLAGAGPGQNDRARLAVQTAAQNTKIKDIDISLETNELALAELNQAKDEVFQKQEQFAEVIGNVQKARQRVAQVESTLGTIEPAIKAVEQDRVLQFSEGQPARGASTPISPKALTVVMLSLLAGVAAGAIFVVLAEILDHVYRSSGQVARSLGLPILEAIDEIVTGRDRRRILVYHAVVTPLVVLCCLGLTGLTGSMAYLSLTQPWTYQRIRHIPEAALHLLVEPSASSPVPSEDG